LPEVRFNWGGANVNSYVVQGGPPKALNQYVLELFEYSSATSGSFTQNQTSQASGKDQNGSWFGCQVQQTINMNVSTVPSSTNLLVTFVQKSLVIDSNPACYSVPLEGVGTVQSVFLLTPQ
jgi:hypothetical protein